MSNCSSIQLSPINFHINSLMTQIIIPANTSNSISKVIEIDIGSSRAVLYLGNYQAASSHEIIKQHKVQSILTIASDLFVKTQHGMAHKVISIQDSPFQCISQYFSQTNEFIYQQLKKGNVLVHCRAGISRSATVVAAFLMKTKKWRMKRALEYLRGVRSIVKPNDGFLQQLSAYQRKLSKSLQAKQQKLK